MQRLDTFFELKDVFVSSTRIEKYVENLLTTQIFFCKNKAKTPTNKTLGIVNPYSVIYLLIFESLEWGNTVPYCAARSVTTPSFVV